MQNKLGLDFLLETGIVGYTYIFQREIAEMTLTVDQRH